MISIFADSGAELATASRRQVLATSGHGLGGLGPWTAAKHVPLIPSFKAGSTETATTGNCCRSASVPVFESYLSIDTRGYLCFLYSLWSDNCWDYSCSSGCR
jgi:hypothetical protein